MLAYNKSRLDLRKMKKKMLIRIWFNSSFFWSDLLVRMVVNSFILTSIQFNSYIFCLDDDSHSFYCFSNRDFIKSIFKFVTQNDEAMNKHTEMGSIGH